MTDRTPKVMVFAGTTEGRDIVAFLAAAGVNVRACVATDYGRAAMKEHPNVEVSSHPLRSDEMRGLMREYQVVVDATHPYAATISTHVRQACEETKAEYIRLRRPSTLEADGIVVVDSYEEAVEYLKGTEGNILLTTGSNKLGIFKTLPGYTDRVYVRALSTAAVARAVAETGLEGPHMILMQGPYSEDLNYDMLLHVGAKYMVTKDSGVPGGFDEKVRAAKRAGVVSVVIGRPPDDVGMDYREVVAYLCEKLGLTAPDSKRKLSIVGTGVGPGTGLTAAAAQAVRSADLVIGARRMLDIPEAAGKRTLVEYSADKIFTYLAGHTNHASVAVLLSGDVGFHSGAKAIIENREAEQYDVAVHCGISSVQYLCAKAGVPWQDVKLISAHGRVANIAGEVRRSPAVFVLLDGADGVTAMCSQLVDYGMGHAEVLVGCDLGYPEEKIVGGTPGEVATMGLGGLCAALVFNPSADASRPICILDSEFVRGDAPMSKSEVRALSVAKLGLSDDSVIYDIGAGTGSVSVEMARTAVHGVVYAIEKEGAAVELIDANRRKFSCPNIEIVKGSAPDALVGLPPPTHAFIGGSSGNLGEIVDAILAKSPKARIVVNSVTLETVSEVINLPRKHALEQEEVVCINAASSRRLGEYNLMVAQNPVYIAAFRGKGA